jgi:hypothetical protein
VPSTSTIRRILVTAGLVTAEPKKRPKSSYRRFEADQPNDASTIADLVGDHVVRPFGVVDKGWAPGGAADGRIASPGPWGLFRAERGADLHRNRRHICVPTASPAVATQAR